MVKELIAFREAGGESMVEVTNDGMGRNTPLLADLSRETGVKIIASTGFYKDPYLPEFTAGWGAKEFARHIVSEIRTGIDGVFPGVIGEVGTSHEEMKPIEEQLLRGAGMAAIETGLPVTTHTTLGTLAREQIDLFDQIGVPMSQVIIGHQDLNTDFSSVLYAVQAGAYVAFDTIGKTNYRPDEDRLDSLLELLNQGFGSQVLLSADLTRKSHWKKYGGPGYGLVLEGFVPRLLSAGLTNEDIRNLFVDNPASAFSIKES
ncbi:phosphotriesterase [Geomicrobium sp. JCM 19039]|uniref:phosphotriesterase family protein n=1 Tax=Geomicrobium sp. JCM 19039 TaxID=1460636 RepID=UPI00045F2AF9|nr:phosphotriesterase [Geomicrobium sp. JCM 19039]GAK13227.1 phosphotriesterase like protein [Geomicrobium sp. JCM 19039]